MFTEDIWEFYVCIPVCPLFYYLDEELEIYEFRVKKHN